MGLAGQASTSPGRQRSMPIASTSYSESAQRNAAGPSRTGGAPSKSNGHAVRQNASGRKKKGVGFYEDDMLFGGVEGDSDEDQLLSRSPESQAMRALRLEMRGTKRPGPKAPMPSNHLARIDLTSAGPAELALPPIPPMSMALEDFPEDLYYNSNMVMLHAAENPMNFDHPWAALSQVTKLRAMVQANNTQPEASKDISVPATT